MTDPEGGTVVFSYVFHPSLSIVETPEVWERLQGMVKEAVIRGAKMRHPGRVLGEPGELQTMGYAKFELNEYSGLHGLVECPIEEATNAVCFIEVEVK